MGLVGILISSSAVGLSFVLSTISIRRAMRGRRTKHQEISTATSSVSADETIDATCVWSTVLINTTTPEIASKRAATVVQSYIVMPAVQAPLKEYTPQAPYIVYNCEVCPDSSLVKPTACSAPQRSATIFESQPILPVDSTLLKEYTPHTSYVPSNGDVLADGFEAFHLPESTVSDDGWIFNESDSETKSCSFAGDGFSSEEERMRSPADDTEMPFDKPEVSQPEEPQLSELDLHQCNGVYEKHAKRVSFQLEDDVGQDREFLYSALANHKPVSADIDARNYIASGPTNDDIGSEERKPFRNHVFDAGSKEDRAVPIVDEAVTEVEEAGSSVASRTITGAIVHSREHALTKPSRPSFVSMEPLGHVPALDGLVTASPISTTPIVTREQDSPASAISDITPIIGRPLQIRNEPESPKVFSLSQEHSEGSCDSNSEGKENVTSSTSSSPERLSRKPRREVERSGMFRRSSQPTLKRFRFSERIKVRPLRASRSNSK